MFRVLKQRIADMRTIRALCLEAERQANAEGEREPGLEHFLLAALELPDGTARTSFRRIGADPDRLRTAIAQQYSDALAGIGIAADALPVAQAMPAAPGTGPYRAKPQVQALMRSLSERQDKTALSGAHVVRAVAAVPHGVAARALAGMHIDARALEAAAAAVLNEQRAA